MLRKAVVGTSVDRVGTDSRLCLSCVCGALGDGCLNELLSRPHFGERDLVSHVPMTRVDAAELWDLLCRINGPRPNPFPEQFTDAQWREQGIDAWWAMAQRCDWDRSEVSRPLRPSPSGPTMTAGAGLRRTTRPTRSRLCQLTSTS